MIIVDKPISNYRLGSEIKIWGLSLLDRLIHKLHINGCHEISIFTSRSDLELKLKNNPLFSGIKFIIKDLNCLPPDLDFLSSNQLYSITSQEFFVVNDSKDISKAHDFLFRSIEKKQVSKIKFFLRYINRPLGKNLLKAFIHLPFSPSTITLFSLFLGFVSSLSFAFNNSLLGAIVLQLSISLDCVDGRLARLKYQTSDFGKWFDGSSDQIKIHSIYLGILFGYFLQHDIWTSAFCLFLVFGSIANFFLDSESEEPNKVDSGAVTSKNPIKLFSVFVGNFENRAGLISICAFYPPALKVLVILFSVIFNLLWIRRIMVNWKNSNKK